jgi:glycosyltransferase involved in cell wall biosynthesis
MKEFYRKEDVDLDLGDGLTYLYLGNARWKRMKQRAQHIAEGIARNNSVIYVNPISDPLFYPLRLTKEPRSEMHVFPRFGWTMISNRLTTVDILGIPGNSIVNRLDDLQMEYFARRLISILEEKGLNPDVLWLSHPRQVGAIHALGSKMLCCYDCMDDWSGIGKPSVSSRYSQRERHILSRADLVFATSKALFEKCSKIARRVVRVPNGADCAHFAPRKDQELAKIRKSSPPVIGFIGNFGSWIDLDLVVKIAVRKPNWILRFVGPFVNNHDWQVLSRISNVELVGEVPFESLPDYVQYFDVCILPFRTDGIGPSINPVKLYEYLATGKPVVSTNLEEVSDFANVIRIADDTEAFINLIEEALADTDVFSFERRINAARANDWENRIVCIEHEVELAKSGKC